VRKCCAEPGIFSANKWASLPTKAQSRDMQSGRLVRVSSAVCNLPWVALATLTGVKIAILVVAPNDIFHRIMPGASRTLRGDARGRRGCLAGQRKAYGDRGV